MKFEENVNKMSWKYDVFLLHILQALVWIIAKDFSIFKNNNHIQIVCAIFFLNAIISLAFSSKKYNLLTLNWVMATCFIAAQILIITSSQAMEQTRAWQISSFLSLGIVVKLKSRMLFDFQLKFFSSLCIVFILFILQQIKIANSLETWFSSVISILGAGLLLAHSCQLQGELERGFLRKELFYQCISSKNSKDEIISYNYSSNKVSLQKGHILQHFDEDDITHSTQDQLKQEEPFSNFSFAEKKNFTNELDRRKHVKKEQSLDTQTEEDVETGCLKLQESALQEIRDEFKHARLKFEEQLRHKSKIQSLKEIFFIGKPVIDKFLYREYKKVEINQGVHNLKGSLRILKFSSDKDCGVILLRQSKFQQLDQYAQRIDSILRFLTHTLSVIHFQQNSSSSSQVPATIEKSDIGIFSNHTRTHLPNISELNSGFQYNFDNPNRGTTLSNVDTFPLNIRKAPQSSNLIVLPNNPQSFTNYGVNQSQKVIGGFNQQVMLQFSQQTVPNNNIKSFNKIPYVVSNISYQQNNIFHGGSASIIPQGGFLQQLTPQIISTQNIINSHQVQQQVSLTQQSQQIVPVSLLIAKVCVQIHCLKSDIREYALSCNELSCLGYQKYKNKWSKSETILRQKYEEELGKEIEQGIISEDKMNILTQERQQIKSLIVYNQQNQQHSNNGVNNVIDPHSLDLLVGADVQMYQFQKKKQKIYLSQIKGIEDMYQQRSYFINIRAVLDSLAKILSIGERHLIQINQNFQSDSKLRLSSEEKQILKQMYGDDIIQDKLKQLKEDLLENNKNPFKKEEKEAGGEEDGIGRGGGGGVEIQEEEMETFRDMIISMISQLFFLYKDYSLGFHISIQRFHTSKADTNPLLAFRNRYLATILEETFNLKENKSMKNKNLESTATLQQHSNLNQNKEEKNEYSSLFMHNNEHAFTNQADNLSFQIKNSVNIQKSGKQEISFSQVRENLLIPTIKLNSSFLQVPSEKSPSFHQYEKSLNESPNTPNMAGQSQEQNIPNENGVQEKKEINKNISQRGNINYKKLRTVRIKIEIQQSETNESQTQEFILNSKYLLQVEEFARFLSPMPMTHQRLIKDKAVIQEYIFYVDNFLYCHHQLQQDQGREQNFELYNNNHLSKSEDEFKLSSCESTDKVKEKEAKIEIASIDEEIVPTKTKRQKSIRHQVLHKISESIANEEANHYSEADSRSPRPPISFYSQLQLNSRRNFEKDDVSLQSPSSRSNMNQQDRQIGESFQNCFDKSSDRRLLHPHKPNYLNKYSNDIDNNHNHLPATDSIKMAFKYNTNEKGSLNNSQINNNNMSILSNIHGNTKINYGEQTEMLLNDQHSSFKGEYNVNSNLDYVDYSAQPNKLYQLGSFPLLQYENEYELKKAAAQNFYEEENKDYKKNDDSQRRNFPNLSNQLSSQSLSQNMQKLAHLTPVSIPSDQDTNLNVNNLNSDTNESCDGDKALQEREERELKTIMEQNQQISVSYQDVHFKNQSIRQVHQSQPYECRDSNQFQHTSNFNPLSRLQSFQFTQDLSKPVQSHFSNINNESIRDQDSFIQKQNLIFNSIQGSKVCALTPQFTQIPQVQIKRSSFDSQNSNS